MYLAVFFILKINKNEVFQNNLNQYCRIPDFHA